MKMTMIVGNPKPLSKTFSFAEAALDALKQQLAEQGEQEIELVKIDLANYGTALVQWDQAVIADLIEQVAASSYLVIASPTYKATYTGLLKLFLDILPMGALHNKLVLPMMVGASPQHQLAVELHLKPVLAELGAATMSKGLYLLDTQLEGCTELINEWMAGNKALIAAFR
ncbi:FMN reductase [Paenibacillus montaniterrae]|uniref:FMN reductase n=1 Tax=Paenibacillus montaniterrae TaxID=429341 RepID=A0A919YQI4_9BACL|nr:NAD(P)H-dependent oxidoreductase [Paenibacillus montaniterrae]GIP17575.1 FMN reductase [Paenibacillus montaniterrae]